MDMKRRGEQLVVEVADLLDSAQILLTHSKSANPKTKLPIQIEIRTLEFWRAIIGECIATFFYVMLLSSTHQALNHPKDSTATIQLYTAVTAGLAMFTLTRAFLQVSGSHFNPAITVACLLMKKITLLRAAMYVCAQCGGAIAGAALVYGVYGRTGAKDQFGRTSIANFGMEFILSFLVAYVFFSVFHNTANSVGNVSSTLGGGGSVGSGRTRPESVRFQGSLSIGLAYMTSLAAYRGSLNPARALGPAFVADAFEHHWVFWAGPMLGATCGAFCYTFIFNMNKPPRWRSRADKEPESLSVRSNDDDMLDDLERARQYKSAAMMANYNDALGGGVGGAGSVYNTAVKPYKRPSTSAVAAAAAAAESVYGGTKSLYNMPPLGYDGANGRRTPGFDSKSMYGGLADPMTGGGDQLSMGGQSRSQLKRSMSVHSRVMPAQAHHHNSSRRHPQDNLPDEPSGVNSGRHQRLHHQRQMSQTTESAANNDRLDGGQVFSSDVMYREYIRQKNAVADATNCGIDPYTGQPAAVAGGGGGGVYESGSGHRSAAGSSSGQCSGGSSSGYYSTSRETAAHDQMRLDQQLLKQQQQQQGGDFHHRRDRSVGGSTRGGVRGGVPQPVGNGGPLDQQVGRPHNYTPSTTSSYGY